MIMIPALVLAITLGHPVAQPDSVWYQQSVVRDLTADGLPDSLILTATGRRVDSLQVTFEIRGQGRLLFRETWQSSAYFFYDAPLDSIPAEAKHDRVMEEFSRFFRPSSFEPLEPVDDPGELPYLLGWWLSHFAIFDSLTAGGVDSVTAKEQANRMAGGRVADTTEVQILWEEMRESSPTTFTFFSGGEYIRTIAWSERHHRFFEVFSCC